MLALWKKIYDKPKEHIKKHKHLFADESHSYDFSCSHVWMWELDHKEGWAPKNWCSQIVVLEKTLETHWTAKWSSQSILKEMNCKEWCWSRSSNTLATWCEEPTVWKRPWFWERLKAGGKGDDRGWDGWMASLTQCTWVWDNSGRWWRTGEPSVLQSIAWQRVRHD